jgi:HEAT repeat protein
MIEWPIPAPDRTVTLGLAAEKRSTMPSKMFCQIAAVLIIGAILGADASEIFREGEPPREPSADAGSDGASPSPRALRGADRAKYSLAGVTQIANSANEISSSLPSIELKLEPGSPVVATVPAPNAPRVRSVLISLKDPGLIKPGMSIEARVEALDPRSALGWTLSKVLNCGDPDVLWLVRQPGDILLRITITPPPKTDPPALAGKPLQVAVRVAELGAEDPAAQAVAFETEPNDKPESANHLNLEETVYGLADDRPYLPLGTETTDRERSAGADWFTFTFESDVPKLAFFALDFVDRDVPPDLRVYRKENGQVVEYTQGIDPQSLQRERPPRMGANKFTTRVLTRGTYFIWVDACQPEYQLRTKLFDVPPYLKPEDADHAEASTVADAARRAVRTAMDFQLLAGDSWHANTPRKGHPLDRVANAHHETSTCVACHPTHFTTQSALAAVKAGYEVEQPFALQFLTERLANNPVPFHGHPQALWARMIPAPANVLGRLSTIVMDYENLVTGSPRDNLHRGIAEFLKLYYDGRTELPADESNGNNPVSRYKVATDSWRQLDETFRRTRDPSAKATRDLVAKLLPTGQPAHTRDLAAQTIGLCLIDPKQEKHAALIQSNVQQLLSLQRASGHWSVKFDPKYPITEMQTGESLYALALAGLKPDHPALRRGIVALLGRQQAFGGWFDLNPYEQFRTPFRETQWAIMSLSALYPDPKTRPPGWNGPLGQEPVALRTHSPGMLIRDLERIWDVPAADLGRTLIAQLGHEAPLVRLAACRALGRVGDESAISGLVQCLGDESKVVRRGAAEALRLMGNRFNGSHPPGATPAQVQLLGKLSQALRSPDDRTRRGATRVFAAHFRELSHETSLVAPLLERCGDSDPVVAMQAIKGLWRWWYWRADPAIRTTIEDALIAGLAQPRHPWVRRNLIEALYIIGDDNIRYLYQNWVPSLAKAESRRLATEGQHSTVNRLGEKYELALERGNRLQREGVLSAMSEFFERPVLGGRIGNDLEPMLFYGDMVPKVAAALTAQLTDYDPTIRRLALEALVTIRGNPSAELARAVARRLGDSDDSVRTWATTMVKEFPFKISAGKSDPATLALIDELSAQPGPEAQAAALSLIGRLGPLAGLEPKDDPTIKIRPRLKAENPTVRAAALNAVRSFPSLWTEQPVHEAIEQCLGDSDPQARCAAVRLALEPKAKVAESALRKALDDPEPAARIALLDRIAAESGLKKDLRLLGVISNSLVDDDHGGVCEKALQLIQSQPVLVANAAIENGLRELVQSAKTADRQREIARALLATRGRSSSGAGDAGERLDIAFFKARVLPIFNHLGEDGQNCMGCHRSHTILKMVPPGKDGEWTIQAVRDNYRAALRVVNLAQPTDSLLLGKPTWEAAEEAEAQNDTTKRAHAGGMRFEKNSREYQTLLDWINGARLPSGSKSAAR